MTKVFKRVAEILGGAVLLGVMIAIAIVGLCGFPVRL